jgi:KDO2-lipid IV(A) lauroyltransferase
MKKIGTGLVIMLFYLLSLIPLPVLFILSDLSYLILFYFVGYRKKIVLNNLSNAFPQKQLKELKQIQKSFYRHFCDLIFESIKNLTISRRSIKRRLRIKNPDLIRSYYAEKKSIILYLGHYGNWEWLAALSLLVPHQMVAFYQPLSNTLFDKLIKTSRQRFGLVAVKSSQGYKALADFANQNILTFTLALGDQSPPAQSNKHWVTFLNQETAFLTGVDRIAKKMDMVVLFPHFSKISRGYYEIKFEVIQDQMKDIESYQIIDKYAKQLESAIIKNPELWLWSHRRWKLKRPLSEEKSVSNEQLYRSEQNKNKTP